MKKYKINSKLVYKQVSDQVIILDEERAEVRELNDVASLIFLNMISWTTLEKISEKISKEYDVSQKEVLRDVNEFVTMYIDKGYILTK
ncbi:MAG: hypothetical protein BroJett025_10230 [Patescibacteria group bacterium]|nr:MAG: hypothetical protein BroJett025_10230 [Patescibacteria group bacterium]